MKTLQEQFDYIHKELLANVDEKTLSNSPRFFKESVKSYGVRIPIVNQIGREVLCKAGPLSKAALLELCDALWASGYLEESVIACNLSYEIRGQYEPADFDTFERWIQNYVHNWASCDTLCNHTVGEFLEMYPAYLYRLKEWTQSENRWMRRAAAVSLIIPARKGLFFEDILQIATRMLTDQDDLVQKGYGWMLKAASEARQKEVFDFVVSNRRVMPRTALRYAIEKMPADMRKVAMQK